MSEPPPLLRADQDVRSAARTLRDSGLPGLPVVDARGRPLGVFGERELIAALVPRYLDALKYARFVPRGIDRDLELHLEAGDEPVERYATREHVDVPADASDADIAETFLHHRVLVLPVVDDGRVVGLVTRTEFAAGLAERLLGGEGPKAGPSTSG